MSAERGFAGRLEMPPDRPFRILQLTDLHLADAPEDAPVYARIAALAAFAKPDLVFLTGDQAMSDRAPAAYARLSATMDALFVPWVFVFGNHDAERGVSRRELASVAAKAARIRYAARNAASGESDFCLEIGTSWIVFGLDTRIDAMYEIDGRSVWGYDAVRPTQVDWFERVLDEAGPGVGSVVFQHIPPAVVRRFDESGSTRLHGFRHEGISAAPVDFGYEAALVRRGTAAVFYGHDHVNDFAFERDGVRFAYGRCSGDYDYCALILPKGGRIVDLYGDGTFDTYVLEHRDVL